MLHFVAKSAFDIKFQHQAGPLHIVGDGDYPSGSVGLPSLDDKDPLAVHVYPDLAVNGDKLCLLAYFQSHRNSEDFNCKNIN